MPTNKKVKTSKRKRSPAATKQSGRKIRAIAHCANCGHRAPLQLVHTQKYLERSWRAADGEEEGVPWSMYVTACEICNRLSVYENLGDQTEPDDFYLCQCVFPRPSNFGAAVPGEVAFIYEEATRIKEQAPNAFAVQIRRALEALADDKGIKKGTLQARLTELAKNGDIPPNLARASDLLRVLGNVGAHASSRSVHQLLAYLIDDFFRAVIEYVYVAPWRLRQFEQTMETYLNNKTADGET